MKVALYSILSGILLFLIYAIYHARMSNRIIRDLGSKESQIALSNTAPSGKNQRTGLAASLFRRLDRWLVSRRSWQHVPASEDKFFYVDIQKYRGKPIVISDQVIIKPGDLLGEIHLDNNKLRNTDLDLRSMIRLLRQELNALAKVTRDDKNFQKVSAYWCRTVLYAFLTREGFTTREVDSRFLQLFLAFWENTLKYVYTKKRHIRLRKPMESWISKEKLLERLKRNDQ